MTNEEAISVIENEIQIDVRICTSEQVDLFQKALYMAISALRADHFRDVTKMVPLTLEQLREMVNKPAYLYIYDTALNSGWHIIKAVTKDKIIFRGWDTVYVPISSLGKCFDLYAYPPAHIDREAWEKPCELCGTLNDEIMCQFSKYTACDQSTTSRYTLAKFCPKCGRPLTSEAWAELEKRLRG